jgi:hypothetical protein
MIFPQEKPLLAGNPKDSAIAANNQAAGRQTDLIKATSGGNRRRHRHLRNKYGGATGGVAVPQYQVMYTPTGTGGQDPNSIIKQNAGISTQSAANEQFDSLAKKGGSRKKRGGNLNWGCYSGGRKKSRSRNHKRKTYKKRRTNRRK